MLKRVLSMRVSEDLRAAFDSLCATQGLSSAELLAEMVDLYTERLQVSPHTPHPRQAIKFQESDLLSSLVAEGGEPDQAGLPHVKRSGTSTRAPRKSSQEKKITQAGRFGTEAFAMAQAFHDALEQRNAVPPKRGWYMEQVGIADAMFKSRKITLQDALSCLSWALEDPWWGVHLTSLAQLPKVWSVYQRQATVQNKPPKWMNELMDWVEERNKEE